jgi:thiol-disulfide isomerase/thioredoxin
MKPLSTHARFAPVLAVLLSSLGGSGCASTALPPTDASVLTAPAGALPLSDGKTLTLGAEKGKVYAIVFYAVWCPVCRKMMKALVDVSTPSRLKKGLVVLAIDEEDPDEKAVSFARAAGFTGPIGLDREGEFIRAMKVETIPSLVAMGRDGVVRRSHASYHGDADLAELGRELDALLAAPKPGVAPSAPEPDDATKP